jgi:WD40 repeat protein
VANYINAVAWDRDGSRLAALSDFGGIVTMWDSRDWSVTKSFQKYGGSYAQNSLSFLPDGTLLSSAPIGRSPDPRYSTLEIFSLVQWDPQTGEPLRYIPDPNRLPSDLRSAVGPAETFTVSRDGLLVAGISKGQVLVFRTIDWSILTKLEIPATPQHADFAASISISPDNVHIAVGTGFGFVHLFDAKSGLVKQTFLAFPGGFGFRCGAVSYSPDGRFLVAGRAGVSLGETDNGWIRIWSIGKEAIVAQLSGGRGAVRAVAWSEGGAALAVGDDRDLRVWDIKQSVSQPRLMLAQSGQFYSVAFSPDETLAASDTTEIMIYN